MPKRTDISKILILGSGPIIIGQSAEFDYSGTQACKALKSEGFEVVLANSNPASIMTDPEFADRTYIEPLTREYLEEIIRIEAEMSLQKIPSALILFKNESASATESLKHRYSWALVMWGLLQGYIHPRSTVYEASSGNTARR